MVLRIFSLLFHAWWLNVIALVCVLALACPLPCYLDVIVGPRYSWAYIAVKNNVAPSSHTWHSVAIDWEWQRVYWHVHRYWSLIGLCVREMQMGCLKSCKFRPACLLYFCRSWLIDKQRKYCLCLERVLPCEMCSLC